MCFAPPAHPRKYFESFIWAQVFWIPANLLHGLLKYICIYFKTVLQLKQF